MSCDINKGGVERILFTLQPNVPQSVTWNFKDCLDGKGQPEPITSFTVAVTKPRDKNLALRALKPGSVALIYTYSDPDRLCSTWSTRELYGMIGTVTDELVTLQLTNTTAKPLEVEVTTSLIIGG